MSEQAQVPVVQAPTPQAPVETSASGGSASGSAASTAGNSATAPPDADNPKIELADGVSKHFAELEKRKAAFEAERKAHAEQRKAEEADRKAFEEYRAARAEAKKDPVKAFGMLGLTPDDIAKALYEAPQQPTEVETLKNNFAELQAKLDKQEQERQAAERARVDAENYKAATSEIEKFLHSSSKYEALKAHKNGVAAVFNRMTAAFAKTQVVPDFDKVCAEVEAEADEDAKFYASIPKYQKLFGPKAETPAKAEVKAQEEKKPAPAEKKVVLSNKTNADAPAGEQRPDDPSALRERAVRALKERLSAKAAALSTKKGAEQ